MTTNKLKRKLILNQTIEYHACMKSLRQLKPIWNAEGERVWKWVESETDWNRGNEVRPWTVLYWMLKQFWVEGSTNILFQINILFQVNTNIIVFFFKYTSREFGPWLESYPIMSTDQNERFV